MRKAEWGASFWSAAALGRFSWPGAELNSASVRTRARLFAGFTILPAGGRRSQGELVQLNHAPFLATQ